MRTLLVLSICIVVGSLIEPPATYYAQAYKEQTKPVILEVVIDWTPTRVEQEIKEVWGPDSHVGIEIAKCESRLVPDAHGTTTNKWGVKTDDRGIFQISLRHHKLVKPYDPKENIRYAYGLYKQNGLDPWRSSRKCWKDKI